MSQKEIFSTSSRFVDEIAQAVCATGELDEQHVLLLRKQLAHGERDAQLYRYLRPHFAELFPSNVDDDDLWDAALLHDIAKAHPAVTGGDVTIWDRPDLSHSDRKKIRRHPHVSFTMIAKAAYQKQLLVPDVVYSIALMHHERINGGGYPFGYTENQIPGYVQLFAIVDMLVGMREGPEERRYRTEPMSPHEIVSYFRETAETGNFSPDMVHQVFSTMSSNGHHVSQNLEYVGDWSAYA